MFDTTKINLNAKTVANYIANEISYRELLAYMESPSDNKSDLKMLYAINNDTINELNDIFYKWGCGEDCLRIPNSPRLVSISKRDDHLVAPIFGVILNDEIGILGFVENMKYPKLVALAMSPSDIDTVLKDYV